MRKRKALAVLIAPIILGGFLFTNTSYQVNAAEVSDIELVRDNGISTDLDLTDTTIINAAQMSLSPYMLMGTINIINGDPNSDVNYSLQGDWLVGWPTGRIDATNINDLSIVDYRGSGAGWTLSAKLGDFSRVCLIHWMAQVSIMQVPI